MVEQPAVNGKVAGSSPARGVLKYMNNIKLLLWRHIKPLQWRALWLAHDKFIVGVNGIIIDKNNNILLLRHKYWPEGTWGLPSGYAERGERLEEALAREVREETGFEIEVERLLEITSGYRLRLEVSYLGRIVGGELKIDADEIIEARFFPFEELPEQLIDKHKKLTNDLDNSFR